MVRRLLPLALAAPLLAGCGGSSAAGQGLQVEASFYPLQYLTQRIVGTHAEVGSLTSPGVEPHDLELDVRKTAAIVDADLVVYAGGLAPAVDDAVDQAGLDHAVDASAVAGLEGDDPHFWLDPLKMARVAAAVEEQLAEVDPDHAATYERNLARLQRQLQRLDDAFTTGLADCAVDTVVVSHDAFGYWSRYGLTFEAINGLSPDAEPSPAHLAQLADLARADGVTTVFSETLASPALADTLAGELGLRTAVLDPVEGLGDATADEDYLSLMRADLRALRTAGGCS